MNKLHPVAVMLSIVILVGIALFGALKVDDVMAQVNSINEIYAMVDVKVGVPSGYNSPIMNPTGIEAYLTKATSKEFIGRNVIVGNSGELRIVHTKGEVIYSHGEWESVKISYVTQENHK